MKNQHVPVPPGVIARSTHDKPDDVQYACGPGSCRYHSMVVSQELLVDFIGAQLDKIGYTSKLHAALMAIQRDLEHHLGKDFRRDASSCTIINNPKVQVTKKDEKAPEGKKKRQTSESWYEKPQLYQQPQDFAASLHEDLKNSRWTRGPQPPPQPQHQWPGPPYPPPPWWWPPSDCSHQWTDWNGWMGPGWDVMQPAWPAGHLSPQPPFSTQKDLSSARQWQGGRCEK